MKPCNDCIKRNNCKLRVVILREHIKNVGDVSAMPEIRCSGYKKETKNDE